MKTLTKTWIKLATLGLGAVTLLAGCGPTVADPFALMPDEHTKGAENPAVTLVEYADLQCPACAQYQPILKRAEQDFGDEVQVVFRHFPLTGLHINALPAAYGAEAAAAQGKFWEMHDLMYARQGEWSSEANPLKSFQAFAGELGLDVEKFTADYEAQIGREKIRYDMAAGRKLNVGGTPTFFVNGEEFPSVRNGEEFLTVLEAKINEAKNAMDETETSDSTTDTES